MTFSKRKSAILSLALALLSVVACEQESEIIPDIELTSESIEDVTSISTADLPSNTLEFVEANFPDEEIVEAYSIISDGELNYETDLSNETSLVFDTFGDLVEFGSESENSRSRRGKSDSDRSVEEIAFEDLPELAQTYIDDNYADSLFIKALLVTEEDDSTIIETSYRALISTAGMLVFDSEGNFEEIRSRTSKCEFEEIEVEDLSETISTYISLNYPDATILEAKYGTKDDVIYTYVKLEDVGRLVFDSEDNFIEIKSSASKSNFEEMAIEDLSDIIATYLTTNYPDAVINKAKTGTIDEEVHTLVALEDVGVLIFDASGEFVELKEKSSKRGKK